MCSWWLAGYVSLAIYLYVPIICRSKHQYQVFRSMNSPISGISSKFESRSIHEIDEKNSVLSLYCAVMNDEPWWKPWYIVVRYDASSWNTYEPVSQYTTHLAGCYTTWLIMTLISVNHGHELWCIIFKIVVNHPLVAVKLQFIVINDCEPLPTIHQYYQRKSWLIMVDNTWLIVVYTGTGGPSLTRTAIAHHYQSIYRQ